MSTNKAVGVELQDLVKIFPAYGSQTEFTAVNHVSLTVEPGEMVTLLGPSGCGKTTILRMIAGFETPTSGCVLVDGKDISHLPPHKRNVGMMFQSYALFPTMSMKNNLKSVKNQVKASNYIKDGSLNLAQKSDSFMYRHVATVPIVHEESHGGSSTPMSSGGMTHGGGGGKF